MKFIRWLNEISISDVPLVGGKTASLGEMFRNLSPTGVQIPEGFAITADAFSALMREGNREEAIERCLAFLKPGDVAQFAEAGRCIRDSIRISGLPAQVADEIRMAYRELCQKSGVENLDVAVRSSATAEDLPEASFAGQQETFLNVVGEHDLLEACLNCFASLYTDRAISYRESRNIRHTDVRLSICVQKMVRSDLACSGVTFTLDTETGHRGVVLVTSSYGLGENIVGGRVDPDEFIVLKETMAQGKMPILRRKCGKKQMRLIYDTKGAKRTKNVEVPIADRLSLSLTDDEVIQLSKWSVEIEKYYSKQNKRDVPMDIEWAKDGRTGDLFIVQARPETVHSLDKSASATLSVLDKKSKVLTSGQAVGAKIGEGAVRIIRGRDELSEFKDGEVLVTEMTDPDWEPVMKKASAVVTDRGGRTCHAAIVSREQGVPCVVGTGDGTHVLQTRQEVTVACSEGEKGVVYEGRLPFHEENIDMFRSPRTKTSVMVNLGNPEHALKAAMLPVDGVGLARIEFIISDSIKIHPMALVRPEKIENQNEREQIEQLTKSYPDNKPRYFVDRLAEGLALIGGAFYPRPVIVRLSDFKTNEYAHLLGGSSFEPKEENPMIGFRGASRYYDSRYAEGFALECQALKYVRDQMGLTNVKVMVPFCRTVEEGQRVLLEMKKNGLSRGENGLDIYIMAEIPSNVLLADEFALLFDGFSIGSNDLTQMTLGVDRDSSLLSHLFNERNPAVLKMLAMMLDAAKKAKRHVGICGQAPSDYPEITKFLVERGIDSISLSTDSVFKGLETVRSVEFDLNRKQASGEQ